MDSTDSTRQARGDGKEANRSTAVSLSLVAVVCEDVGALEEISKVFAAVDKAAWREKKGIHIRSPVREDILVTRSAQTPEVEERIRLVVAQKQLPKL